MRKVAILVILVASLAICASAQAKMVMLADFNSGSKPNNLGGDFGSWIRILQIPRRLARYLSTKNLLQAILA